MPLLPCLLALPVAQASDTWTVVRTGVDYLLQTTAGPQDIYAVRVDLTVPNVGLHASADEDGTERHTSTFARNADVLVAINGDWSDGNSVGKDWGYLACTATKQCTIDDECRPRGDGLAAAWRRRRGARGGGPAEDRGYVPFMLSPFLLSLALAATPEAIEQYTAGHLHRAPFALVEIPPLVDPQSELVQAPWGVFDGKGALLSAEEFAARTGDAAMQRRLRKERRSANGGDIALGVVAEVAASGGMSATGNGSAPADATNMGRQETFGTQTAARQRQVFRYYAVAETDRRITAYNHHLRRTLGLTAEEAEVVTVGADQPLARPGL